MAAFIWQVDYWGFIMALEHLIALDHACFHESRFQGKILMLLDSTLLQWLLQL